METPDKYLEEVRERITNFVNRIAEDPDGIKFFDNSRNELRKVYIDSLENVLPSEVSELEIALVREALMERSLLWEPTTMNILVGGKAWDEFKDIQKVGRPRGNNPRGIFQEELSEKWIGYDSSMNWVAISDTYEGIIKEFLEL